MTLPLRRVALLALLLLVTAACAGSGRQGKPSMREDAASASVRIQNQSWVDVVMYVDRGGQRFRLGSVAAQGTRSFRLPAGTMFGTVTFVADPVGGSRMAQSYNITVTPGEEVNLTIPPGSF